MTILYLSYNGALEPLGQSQVLPYLRGLADLGHRFALMSYEKPADWRNHAARAALSAELAAHGITWLPRPYHQRPTAPATLYDLAQGLARSLALAQRLGCSLIHVRSYLPMTIGLALKRLLGARVIFDMRGFWADERVDTGQTTTTSRQYRTIKALEQTSLRHADHVVTLTHAALPHLNTKAPVSVIPCCADLAHFRPRPAARVELRRQHGWEDRRVVVYSGSLGPHYMEEELAAAFALWRRSHPAAHLLVLSRSDTTALRAALAAQGVPTTATTFAQASRAAMPEWLSAADIAVSFVRPTFAKIASSPTKLAEYLGCGLPVIATAAIGDTRQIFAQGPLGALIETGSSDELAAAWAQATALATAAHASQRRALAKQHFALEQGVAAYAAIYAQLGAGPLAAPR